MLYILIFIFYILLMEIKIPGLSTHKKLGMCFFIFWLVSTFRAYTIGNDTLNYSDMFYIATSSDFFDVYSWRFEEGYLLTNIIIREFSDDFTVFLAVINSFIYYTYYRYIKIRSNDPIFSALLFMCLGFFGQTMNVLRLQLAMCICLWADEVRSGRVKFGYVWFTLLIAIACLFQKIAFVYMIALILPRRINFKRNMIFLFGTIICMLFIAPIFTFIGSIIPYFSIYLDSSVYHIGEIHFATILSIIIQLLTVMFSYYSYHSFSKNMTVEIKELFAYDINKIYVAMLITVISLQFNLLDRCAGFYWVTSLILIPNVVGLFRFQNNSNKMILKLIGVVVSFAYFFIITFYKTDWNMIYPYISIFEG